MMYKITIITGPNVREYELNKIVWLMTIMIQQHVIKDIIVCDKTLCN